MSQADTDRQRSIDRTITDQGLFRYNQETDSLKAEHVDIELDWNLSHYKGTYLLIDVWAGEDHIALLWIDDQGVRDLLEELLQECDRDGPGP